MKKIAILLLLVLTAVAGCGKHEQRTFTVINESDWRAVVVVTDLIDDVGNEGQTSSIVIGERNNARGLPQRVSFTLGRYGDCNLASVNGAKIKSKTDSMLVLENAVPVWVSVINLTGKDVWIKNEPYLGGLPVDFYYGGRYKDLSNTVRNDYKPLFMQQRISHNSVESNPVQIPVYAWQLFEITDTQAFTNFAAQHILLMSDTAGLHAVWSRSGDSFFLRITN